MLGVRVGVLISRVGWHIICASSGYIAYESKGLCAGLILASLYMVWAESR